MKFLATAARNLLLEQIHQCRHAAQHVGRRRNHSRPDGSLLLKTVERPRIVVEPLGEKLELLPLHNGISIGGRIELRALREVGRVTGDA